MSLIPSNRFNPCPICEDSTGKCRQGREDSQYWQCMTYADSKKGEVINGYKCLGSTKCWLWGQFRVDNSQEWEEEKRLEWQRENKRRKQEQARVKAQLSENALSIDQRNTAIRKLHQHFGLSARHQQDLKNRGLSDKAIEKHLYFSITPNQKVPDGIPTNLPGVKFGKISAAGSGYACIAFTPEGKAVGWQIRLDGVTDNKYRWAKGEASSHLNNGELPITSAYPIELKRSSIGMCEGLNKAIIAAHRRGQIFIGASSANFAASTEQLKEYLQQASNHLGGTKRIEWAADAGSLKNPHILKIYQRAWDLLREWGYEVFVSWWGQTDKSHSDIDELDDCSVIQHISTNEFLSLATNKQLTKTTNQFKKKSSKKKYIKPIKELPKVKFKVLRTEKEALLEKFEAWQSNRGQEWLKLRKFTPDVTIDSRYFDYDFKPEENLAIKSGLGTGKSHFTNAKWLANPDKGAVLGGYRNCLNEQFCANGEKLNGQPWYQIQQDLKGSEDRILISDKQSRIAGAVDSWVYFDSHHFDEKNVIFDEIESVAKHLNQSSTAVSFYRDLIKQRVQDALTNSAANLIADGNLRDFTVEYLEKLSGRKFTKVLNEYTRNRGKIYLYNGSSRKKQATEEDIKAGLASTIGEWISFDYRPDDYSKLHRSMMDIPIDIPLLILSDSQRKCEAWDQELTEIGRKVFRLDSTTSTSDLGLLFLRNPKEFILSGKIDTVILSPSAESGVSIELADELGRKIPGYFKYEFSYFFGTSTTDTQTQFLGRNRDPYAIKFCFVQKNITQKRRISDINTSADIFQDWAEIRRECAALSLKGVEQDEIWKLAEEKIKASLFDHHAQYEAKIELKESFEQAYPRLCLEYALREQGWDVAVIEGREDTVEDLLAIQEENDERKSKEIFTAETIELSEADVLARKLRKEPEERNQVTKSRLLSRLPGIETKVIQEEKKVTSIKQLQQIEESEVIKPLAVGETSYEEWKASGEAIPEKGLKVKVEKPAFDAGFVNKILHKDRAFVSRLEMQFLLRNPELCKRIQQNKWYRSLDLLTNPDKATTAGLPLARYRSKLLEVSTLIEMGIEFFLNPENSWHDNSPEAIAFWEKGKLPRIARNAGISAEGKPCSYIGKILARFGLKTDSKEKKNPEGKRYREYSIEPMESLSQAVYGCVDERVKKQVSSLDFDWKKILQNSGILSPETVEERAIQLPHLPPDNSIKIREQVCIASSDSTSEKSVEAPKGKLEQLIEILAKCQNAEELLLAIDGESLEDVEAAILYQDDVSQKWRLNELLKTCQNSGILSAEAVEESAIQLPHLPPNNLIKIREEVCITGGDVMGEKATLEFTEEVLAESQSENWMETIKVYGQLLAEGFEHGIEVIKDLLMPWSSEERWGAFLELERLAPSVMKQLDEAEPNWTSWCDA